MATKSLRRRTECARTRGAEQQRERCCVATTPLCRPTEHASVCRNPERDWLRQLDAVLWEILVSAYFPLLTQFCVVGVHKFPRANFFRLLGSRQKLG